MNGPPEKPRVFVVDDEAVIATTLGLILDKAGFQARTFTDPVDALDSAVREVPDLLVSDVVMPRMSGVELAVELTTKCPQCKVLLFSGQAGTADLLEDAKKHGHAFEILAKPLHPTDFLRAVRKRTTEAPL